MMTKRPNRTQTDSSKICFVYMIAGRVVLFPMDSKNPVPDKKIICRLCARDNGNYFEIFSDEGIALKIASVVATHFCFELRESDEHRHICRQCWIRIEDFHVFYLRIQDAQQCFEPADEWKVKAEPMDIECSKYNIDESVDSSCTTINDKRTEDTDDCVNPQDETTDVNVQLGSDVVRPNQSTMSLRLRDIILQVDTTPKDSHPLSKRVRGMRKRDHPSVLAGDDLIRNWCEMQCTICTESFKSFTFKDVKKHYSQKHELNGFLVCCRKKFFRRIRVLEHIARHINPREFSCETCNKIFSDKPALLNHLDSHVSLDKRAYKCDMCDDSFVRNYQLSQHKNSRHPSNEETYNCNECPKKFKSKSILHAHIRNVHDNKNTLMCDVCAKTFKSKQCLEQHFSKHKSEAGEESTKLQCTICSAWLKHPNSLRGHMARHLDAATVHVCQECEKTYPTRGALRSHRTYVHNNTKVFPCTICPKTFKRSVTLKEHIAGAHTGEVLYQCPFCTKTFNSSANFYAHKKRKHRKGAESAT